MRKYRNQIILGLLISVAIYVLVLIVFDSQGQSTAGVAEALAQFPVAGLFVVALAQTGTFFTRFFTWQYYMGVVGAHSKMSLGDSALIFVTGFVMVVSPGKAAELLKAVLVKVKTDVPVARTVPVIVAERVVDGLSVLALLTLTLIVSGDLLDLGDYYDFSRTIVFSSSAFIGFALVAVQVRPLGNAVLRVIASLPFIRRAHHWFTDLYESAREIFSPRHVAVTAIFGFGTYGFTALAFILTLAAFGLPLSLTLCLQATFIVGVGTAIGALSFIPNGAGITEFSQAAMLMAIVAPSHPELTVGVAAAAALIEGFFHKWYRVIVGLGITFIFRDRLFTPTVERELAVADG